ncbi:reverse transcriptase domain-containing protein [Tanacetum coccineum]
MPTKRTSTSEAPAMTQAAIRKLVADSVTSALEAQAATTANTSNPNRNTGTLTDVCLSWWKCVAQSMGVIKPISNTWTELKWLLTNKYCPRTEVRKMEDELYNLTVKKKEMILNLTFEVARISKSYAETWLPNTEKNLLDAFIEGLARKY